MTWVYARKENIIVIRSLSLEADNVVGAVHRQYYPVFSVLALVFC